MAKKTQNKNTENEPVELHGEGNDFSLYTVEDMENMLETMIRVGFVLKSSGKMHSGKAQLLLKELRSIAVRRFPNVARNTSTLFTGGQTISTMDNKKGFKEFTLTADMFTGTKLPKIPEPCIDCEDDKQVKAIAEEAAQLVKRGIKLDSFVEDEAKDLPVEKPEPLPEELDKPVMDGYFTFNELLELEDKEVLPYFTSLENLKEMFKDVYHMEFSKRAQLQGVMLDIRKRMLEEMRKIRLNANNKVT